MFPLDGDRFETDIHIPDDAILYVTRPDGIETPMSFERIRIMTQHPNWCLACPECFTPVRDHCWHEGAEVYSVKMDRAYRDTKRAEWLKYEIEDLEERQVSLHQEYHQLCPEQYELEGKSFD